MLVLLYLASFFVLFCLAFALPDLVAGFRELPRGAGELSPEELEQASRITRDVLLGGRLLISFLAAGLSVGVGIWFRALPGLR